MNQTTYFSGGRFEGLIDIFKNRPGVLDVVGGLCLTKEGQRESVLVKYDDEIINYEKLVSQFIKNIDLTDGNGQFDDRGNTYLSTCYYQSEAEIVIAKQVIEKAGKHFKEIFVKLLPFESFEAYEVNSRCETLLCIKRHQAKIKSEKRYEKIAAIWRGTYHEKLKTLSPLAFEVTKNSHTERPYTSDYVTNSKKGIYVDIISNEPLFSSLDQFDAGCGWPSFTKPITKLLEKKDTTYGMHRIEIRSIHSDAHLGHVFDDGPLEKGGLRYCINGASLKFIAYDDLEKEGFKAYEALFK